MLGHSEINRSMRESVYGIWQSASFNFENNPARLNRARIKQQICSTTREIACVAATDACFFFSCSMTFPASVHCKSLLRDLRDKYIGIFIKVQNNLNLWGCSEKAFQVP